MQALRTGSWSCQTFMASLCTGIAECSGSLLRYKRDHYENGTKIPTATGLLTFLSQLLLHLQETYHLTQS